MKEHFKHFSDPHFRRSIFLSLGMLICSLIINFYAGVYATDRASNPVTDIILSNTRVHDLDGLFIYGSWFLFLAIVYLCFRKPWRAPFIIKTISLFVVTRALFFSVTHIGPFPTEVPLDLNGILSYFVFGGDLFFSGHTGLPFLLALIHWKEKPLRYIFLVTSIVLGVVVLLTHLHYTIDVLSAFFISYGIFHIAEHFFKKDKEFFLSN